MNNLYFRLNVFPILMPSLRDRREDIPDLIMYFISTYSAMLNRSIPSIDSDLINLLMKYDWPGNVRELENLIHRSLVRCKEEENLSAEHFPNDVFGEDKSTAVGQAEDSKFISLEDYERNYIVQVLKFTNGRISGKKGAARILKINPNTLRSRLGKLGISLSEMK